MEELWCPLEPVMQLQLKSVNDRVGGFLSTMPFGIELRRCCPNDLNKSLCRVDNTLAVEP